MDGMTAAGMIISRLRDPGVEAGSVAPDPSTVPILLDALVMLGTAD